MSTGSRSPILIFILLILSTIIIGRNYSISIYNIYRNRCRYSITTIFVMIIYMITTTSLRIESEELNSDVFKEYFKIIDFGFINSMVETANTTFFFISTVITYSASTYNNIIIRFQEISYITPSFGYRYFFYIISALKIMLPEPNNNDLFFRWKDLATENNIHLLNISTAAGQWATPIGDLIWDFGLPGSVLITIITFYLLGRLIRRTQENPSIQNLLLTTIILATFLLPLTHPFLSLYFQYLLFICLCLRFRIFNNLITQK